VTTRPARRAIAATLVALATACSTPPRQALVESAPTPRPIEGTVAVLTTLTGERCRNPAECAQERAVRNLLFVGVPGSPIARPMVNDEQQALRQHAAYFDELFGRKGYARFVVRVNERAAAPGAPRDAQSYVVLVNTDALRRSLEQAGVVRRFGY
jgi:hypothetical protein